MRLLRFALLAAFGASAAHSADANSTYEPPEEAMPGLRYYEPKTTVDPRTVTTDVCVYGGTSGGVIAAVQAARMGRDVVLLEFGRHVGGLTTGGLVRTDGGGPDVTGGLAAEFYGQVGREMFSPEAAEAVFREMLQEAGVHVRFRAHLESVDKAGTRIESITMEDGLTVRAKQFIDATYEGDLLARAGVAYAVGREPNSLYGETYDGIREPGTGGHNIPVDISAYVRPGDPSSGLLPRVTSERGEVGAGDKSIQAYCFRMWLTRDNPRPIPKPTDYDPLEYEILARIFEAGVNPNIFDAPDHNRKAPRRLDPVDGVRFSNDTNNHHLFAGAYFIDYVGGADGWPGGNYRERERIFQEHANYQIGLMWFLQNSDRIPEKWQKEFREWGLPRDIYEDTGGWPHQLYIREARRMKSDYVMTEHNCLGRVVPEDSVGIASYTMDSHHCRLVEVDGIVLNEGNVEVRVKPYPVAYRALTPKREECTNLLVPVALSSSHTAFGSMRMEPVFMLLGQSAATAASLAIDDGVAVQDVEYPKLRKQLLADGQILEHPAFATPQKTEKPNQAKETTEIDPESLEGIVIDKDAAKLSGPWVGNDVTHPRVGRNYHHDKNAAKGKCVARYEAELPRPGRYDVRLLWPPHPNRASNVPVTVHFEGGKTKTTRINQKTGGEFRSVGEYVFDGTATVEISNAGTDGYVIADAVQFLPAETANRGRAPK